MEGGVGRRVGSDGLESKRRAECRGTTKGVVRQRFLGAMQVGFVQARVCSGSGIERNTSGKVST